MPVEAKDTDEFWNTGTGLTIERQCADENKFSQLCRGLF